MNSNHMSLLALRASPPHYQSISHELTVNPWRNGGNSNAVPIARLWRKSQRLITFSGHGSVMGYRRLSFLLEAIMENDETSIASRVAVALRRHLHAVMERKETGSPSLARKLLIAFDLDRRHAFSSNYYSRCNSGWALAKNEKRDDFLELHPSINSRCFADSSTQTSSD
jgi:hypothetical protein